MNIHWPFSKEGFPRQKGSPAPGRQAILGRLSELGSGPRRTSVIRTSVLLIFFLWLAGCGGGNGGLVVNSTGDESDSSPGNGTCRTAASATECTLRAAIEEANAAAGAQTITFDLPAGSVIYVLRQLPTITGSLSINGTLEPDSSDRDAIVEINGEQVGEEGLTISAGGLIIDPDIPLSIHAVRIRRFQRDGILTRGNLTLGNVEIADNQWNGIEAQAASGDLSVTVNDSIIEDNGRAGIHGSDALFTLENVTLRGNLEGGITATGGNLYLKDSLVTENASGAHFSAGGIYFNSSGDLTILDSTIEDNTFTTDWGGAGGVNIKSVGTALIRNSVIRGNSAEIDAGGIDFHTGTLNIEQTLITENSGGVVGGINSYGEVRLRESTVTKNTGNSAGGIRVAGGVFRVEDGSYIGREGEGNISAHKYGDFAGGILNDAAEVTVADSTIEGNTGNGLQSYCNIGSTDIAVYRSVIRKNSGMGIIATDTNLEIEQSSILENDGGGISVLSGYLGITESRLADNQNSGLIYQGGYYIGFLVMRDTTVSGNRAIGPGGGIYIVGVSHIDISQSTISNNFSALGGGGIALKADSSFTAALKNVTITGNTASASGGGLQISGDGMVNINHATITGNSSPLGGGISTLNPTVYVSNSILAGNAGGDCAGGDPLISQGHNLTNGDSCQFMEPGDLSAASAILGLLLDNGGPTFTHALLPGSPAIDAGDDGNCLPTDQRGVARPLRYRRVRAGESYRRYNTHRYPHASAHFHPDPNTAVRRLRSGDLLDGDTLRPRMDLQSQGSDRPGQGHLNGEDPIAGPFLPVGGEGGDEGRPVERGVGDDPAGRRLV
jgi:CSLREA domain-containing protein